MGPELIEPQTEPPHSYKRFKGRILFKTATVKGADYDSFRPLNHLWACDKNRVYCYGSPLRGADLESVTVLNALYAKDKNFAYYLSGKIPAANPATFRALGRGWHLNPWSIVACQGYAADDQNVFHHVLTIGKPRLIKGADVGRFVFSITALVWTQRKFTTKGSACLGPVRQRFDYSGRITRRMEDASIM